ncbi:RusA family crossover junction endodeoxyribonuclease [Actinacidiphila sp. ITFR-21]|uniref:RusA family crossover junction endodeoxyribonuclease n=1 Tax=Actinacidiphila sp. ITFR-21 TaxID=3075199 RepID=UPI00288B9B19|nr:RusA family crossover junction endodeoxyribonuclease [Streptomyces sp. ITFR-21]WNI20322.1 RusA family crossover junction endodeoxyribonuclease [Streptomyces sp. ITFR-21]
MTDPVATPAGSLLPAGGREQDQERARLLAAALAPGAGDVLSLVWGGEPPSKTRPRFADGRTYKDPADEAAEAKTGWNLRRLFRQPWTGNLAVGLVFFRSDRRRIDVDNMIKHVLDAGNGIGWVDDHQVTALYGVAELDAQFPRTLLVVTRHVSSLDRTPVVPAVPRKRAPAAAPARKRAPAKPRGAR